MRARWVRVVASVASLVLAGLLLAVALPRIAGVGWAAIGARIGALSTTTLLWLTIVWFAGLWCYTYVLTSSLPGLTHTQALVLNCAGSAVSNLLPFGGAAGVAVTFAMAGSWGHRRQAIAVSTLVSGAWNVLSRLALPAVGLVVSIASGYLPGRRFTVAAGVATTVLAAALALAVAALTCEATGRWAGQAVDRIAHLLPGRSRPALLRAAQALSQLRQTTVEVTRRGWPLLTLGMASYLCLQCVLFWACLTATGTHLGARAAIPAFALSRLLATAPITPGGAGVSESGTAAVLIALGAQPASTAAALLLFAFFSYTMEIPAGGLAWLTWATAKRWRAPAERYRHSRLDAGRPSGSARPGWASRSARRRGGRAREGMTSAVRDDTPSGRHMPDR
jgi:uncharacterized membrane protein YbhN (UPF0104 family)